VNPAQMNTLAKASAAASTWREQLAGWSYRPFIDPINAHHWWWALIVPLALLTAVAYKAVRLPTLERYWREVALMSVQVLLGMAALAATLWLLVEVFARSFRSS